MHQRSSRNKLEFIFKYCFRTSHGPRLKMLVSKTGTTINISLFVAQEVVFFCCCFFAVCRWRHNVHKREVSEQQTKTSPPSASQLPQLYVWGGQQWRAEIQHSGWGKKDRRAEGKRRGTDTCIIQMQIISLNQDAERTCAGQQANTVSNYTNHIIY